MSKTGKDLAIIIFTILFSTFLVWLPHLLALPNFWNLDFSAGFNTIYRNFDGLEYIIIAKTFYDPALIAGIPQALPANYFASHFPGFPLLIFIFAPLLGYLKSMLLVTVFFTIASSLAFYFLVKDFKLTVHPLFLTLVFLFLPARWLIVRSVGSPEPIFIFFVILSIYFFLRATSYQLLVTEFIWISAIFAALAQLVRPPGMLLMAGLGLYVLWQAYKQKSIQYFLSFYPFLTIPLTLLGIFYFYGIQYGDFLAYFHSGDNIHLTFPPFQIFNTKQYWVESIWLEDIVYIFLLGFLGGLLLFKEKVYPVAFFVLTYLFASIFVAHRDISRYTLPIAPFVIIAYEKVINTKYFKITLAILALGIYLYCQNYLINNIAPVPDLSFYD
ncbi:MAG: hypothetical protein HYW45_00755 [Candidatus Daviesbacteria bacterium]|nr:MAG: hypothetical protein HYW45_00755 [Candidatus Daviesbacteria bacterium]